MFQSRSSQQSLPSVAPFQQVTIASISVSDFKCDELCKRIADQQHAAEYEFYSLGY